MNVPAKPPMGILSPEPSGNGILHGLLAELRIHSPVVWPGEPAHEAFPSRPTHNLRRMP